jgi:hypothetical protein
VAQKNREDFLYNFYQMGRDAIDAGEAGGPFAYVVDLDDQHDPGEAVELLNALRRGGVVVERATAPSPRAAGRTRRGATCSRPGRRSGPTCWTSWSPRSTRTGRCTRAGRPSRRTAGLAGYTLPIQMGVTSAGSTRRSDVETEPVDGCPCPPPA